MKEDIKNKNITNFGSIVDQDKNCVNDLKKIDLHITKFGRIVDRNKNCVIGPKKID